MSTTMIIDTLWVFLAAILVFFMNLGFASVEAGFARSKNTVNILSKNFIVFAVSSLGFMLLGWGLMFGGDNPFIGTEHLFVLGTSDFSFYENTLTSNVPFWGKILFPACLLRNGRDYCFRRGRRAYKIYLFYYFFFRSLTLVIYPIVGHWVWGGGWLSQLGFMDFAGDTVVHSVGGWAALAGVIVLGPRIGKYDKDGKPKAIPGHNMSLAVIGLFVLWLGWFGFNPGSTMSFQNPSDAYAYTYDDKHLRYRRGPYFYGHVLDFYREARSRNDYKRLSRGPCRNYGRLRLCHDRGVFVDRGSFRYHRGFRGSFL